ncbi:hypothetical protein QTO17_06855 [Vibrio owensii]
MSIEHLRNDKPDLMAATLKRFKVEAMWDVTEEQEDSLKQSMITRAKAIKESNCERELQILKNKGLEEIHFTINELRQLNVEDFNHTYYISCEIAYCREVEQAIHHLERNGCKAFAEHLHVIAIDFLMFDFMNEE